MADVLLTGVPAADAERARRSLRPLSLAAGAVLWAQSDASPALAVVEDGVVEIVRDGVVIDTSGPGEVVGEMSLFHRRPRSATVRAVSPTRLTMVDRDGYESMRSTALEVAGNLERRILDQQVARLRRLDRLISESKGGIRSPFDTPAPGVFDRIRSLFGAPSPASTPTVDVAVALARSRLFAEEPASALGILATQLDQRAFPANAFLVRQGEPGQQVFILVHGSAAVFVHRPSDADPELVFRVGTLREGDACGFTSLADGRGRVASVVASEPVTALVLERARWHRWLVESTRVASTVRAAMIRAYALQLADAGGRLAAAVIGREFAEAAGSLEHSGTVTRTATHQS